ncbi:glycine--tRNA ligase subunit beta, partial [Candidatus Pelagibacter sp.]|nr:glycine--tRNA ligase subunit beta [Candidatus Pelagibacter sp.]
MSEFFIELFSEEIPAGLQRDSRNVLLENFQNLFEEKKILFKKSSSFSTPNRLIILFEGLSKEITQKAEEIKGPNVNAPDKAVEGFLRSNQIDKKDLFIKKIEKGEFYFFKKPSNKTNTIDLLQEYTPLILDKLQWKKSMIWGNYNLSWARPLKSILAIFGNKSLDFKFHHLTSSNTTFTDKEFEDKKKIFKTFKSYKDFFNQSGIIIDHVLRKDFIAKEIEKISSKNNFIVETNNKLLNEVTDIVEQ